MSSAPSNQLFVYDRVGYDEVYLSGHKDPDNPSEEKSLSASSPSLRDEDLETERPKDDSSEGLDDAKPPVQSIVGPNGLREFIMLPYGRSMTLPLQLKNLTLKHLGRSTKSPSTYPSVYPTCQKSVTTRVLRPSGFMNRCCRQGSDSP